jgi:hypothetical protein
MIALSSTAEFACWAWTEKLEMTPAAQAAMAKRLCMK